MIQIDKNDIKILIIDDNPKNIQVAMNVLSKEGYHLLYAQDGKKGIELAKENDISLILLDILMPQMDGYEVCKELKNYYKTWDIPVIFLTVKDEVEDIVKGFEYGGVDYITKPFSPQILLKRVETHLKLFLVTNELQEMSDNLAKEIERQVEETRIKDQILFQQAKMASMGEMIANIAHQWKQPLSAISSAIVSLQIKLELDNMKDFKEYAKDKFNSIEEYIKVLSHTIDDFQNFFKPQKKKEEFDIQDSVNQAVSIIKATLDDSGITIKNSVKPTKVYGFKNELSQILINLLDNARDALIEVEDKDKKEIEISSKLRDGFVDIIVSDNANGIPKEIRDSIFKAYFTTKDEQKGTGIGLYMVKEIVEKHLGGYISVQSDENGSSFTISLPLYLEE